MINDKPIIIIHRLFVLIIFLFIVIVIILSVYLSPSLGEGLGWALIHFNFHSGIQCALDAVRTDGYDT